MAPQKGISYLYLDGNYVRKEKRINYLKYSLNLSKYFKIKSNKFINISAGGYYSYALNSVIILTSKEYKRTIPTFYKKYDFGSNIKLSYIITGRKVYIETGSYFSYGITNLFSSTEKIPAYLHKSNNLSIGVSINIGFFK